MKRNRRRLLLQSLLGAAITIQSAAGSPLVLNALEKAVPRAEQADETVLYAADFGADPYGIKDSTRAIQDVLAAAKEAREAGASHVRIVFEKGEYQIWKDYASKRVYHTSNTSSTDYPEKTIGILIEDMDNVTIDGGDSLFMMHGNMMALAVVNSHDINLENFSWDFAVPTTSEMTVLNMGTENGKQYTDFYIPKCFPYTIEGNTLRWTSEVSPYTGQTYWSETGIHRAYAISAYDPAGQFSRRFGTGVESPFKNVSSITPVEGTDGTIVRFTYSTSRPAMQKLGMVLELNSSTVRETAGAFIWESENVSCDNIHVHYMHGFGWLLQMSKDVYFRNCSMEPREGSGHITSSYADGIHASGAAGDLVVENCHFDGLHDDPINIHGTFTRVENRVDSKTLRLKYIHAQQGGFPQFHVGDKVAFFSRDTLESADAEKEYTVAEVISNPGEDSNDLKTMVVRFEEDMPDYLLEKIGSEPKYVAENRSYTPDVSIKNNTFQNLTARAILCTTRGHVEIEGNTFYNTSMATIYLSNDSNNWYESGPIRDMTIKNNTFYIKDTGERSWEYRSAVYVNPVTKNGGLPSWENPVHKNITIESNTFNMSSDTVVNAESVENLTIKNNRIQRTDPNVSITMDTTPQTLSKGATASLNAAASGFVRSGQTENMYEFKKCKNVVISGNSYDEGQKLYARLNGTPEETVSVENDAAALTTERNNAASAAAGTIYYASTDPEVISVESDGTLKAKAAGTAEVYAYTLVNGSLVKSGTRQITVTEAQSENAPEIEEADSLYLDDDSRKVQLHASGNCSWSVVNLLDGKAADKASIDENGLLSWSGNGLFKVTAFNESGSDSIVVVTDTGRTDGLSSGVSIRNENAGTLSMNETSATITLQTGDLYGTNNGLKNLIMVDLPENIDSNSFKTIVHVTNMPTRESGQWDTASFLLYQDVDNYISLGKKSHYDGFAAVREVNASAQELGDAAADNSVTDAWLGFTKNGNTISLDVRNADGTWKQIRTLDGSMLNENMKAALGAWHTNDRGKTVTFSDLKFASADTDYQDMMDLDSVSLMNGANENPVITAAFEKDKSNAGQPVSIQAQLSDPDGNLPGSLVYRYIFKNQAGDIEEVISENSSYTPTAAGTLKAVVYGSDSVGMQAKPVMLDEIVIENSDEAKGLISVKVNGTSLYESGKAEADFVLPADLEKIWLDVAAGSDVTINGNPFAENGVINVKDLDTLQIACNDETFIVHLNKKKDASCAVESMAIDAIDWSWNKTDTPILQSSTKNISLEVEAMDGNTIKVFSEGNGTPLALTDTENGKSALLSLKNGTNTYLVQAVAEDGISYDLKVVNIVYTPATAAELISLSVNDQPVDLENPRMTLADQSASAVLKLETSDLAHAEVLCNKKLYKGNEVTIDQLEPGMNEVTVVVTAQDGLSKTEKTLRLMVPHADNALADRILVEGKNLDVDQDEFDLVTSLSNPDIQVDAQDERALIQISDAAGTRYGKGSLKTDLRLSKDHPKAEVSIVSSDGTVIKTYTLNFEKAAWLSDLSWDSDSTTGYGTIQKDLSNAGVPLRLTDQDGNAETFEKGIGAHANCQVNFTLPANTYSALEGAVGVDYAKNSSTYANIKFSVLKDGQTAFESSVMEGNTPYQSFNIDLEGVSKISLKAVQSQNSNWDAHADFAGLKLKMDFDQLDTAGLNTDDLKTAMANMENVVPDQKPELLKNWMDAIDSANALLDHLEGKTQDDIDQAAADINQAYAKLMGIEAEKANKDGLKVLIDEIEAADLDQNDYTSTSWTAFHEALDHARDVFNDEKAEQTTVDDAEKALDEARKNLVRIYTVTFMDGETVIDTIQVESGKSAAAPAAPEKEGYVFKEWDTAFDAVEEDLIVKAVYEKIPEIEQVDKTELETVRSDILNEFLAPNYYTKDSWDALSKALDDAYDLLVSENATQQQVDQAIISLRNARENLKADPSILENRIKEIEEEGLLEEKHTPESWMSFVAALNQAKDLLKTENPSLEALQKAHSDLNDARAGLVEKEEPAAADKSKLIEALEKAGTLNKADYTEDSWNDLALAVDQAKALLEKDDAAAEDIDQAVTNLENTMAQLVKKPPVKPEDPTVVDKAALASALKKAEGLDENKYTADSWKALSSATDQAKAILNKEDASEDEISQAVSDLVQAMDQLKEKEPELPSDPEQKTDKSKLQEAYDSASALNKEDYTDSSWKEFEKVLAAVSDLLENPEAIQKDVDDALTTLKAAVENLEKKQDQITPPDPDKNQKPSDSDDKNQKPADDQKQDSNQNQNSGSNTGTKPGNTAPASKPGTGLMAAGWIGSLSAAGVSMLALLKKKKHHD